jgi:hypothetical protein
MKKSAIKVNSNMIKSPEVGELWWVKSFNDSNGVPFSPPFPALIVKHNRQGYPSGVGGFFVKDSWVIWVVGCDSRSSDATPFCREFFLEPVVLPPSPGQQLIPR